MATVLETYMRRQLTSRRERLQRATENGDSPAHLPMLLKEVDRALARMEDGTFGICEECHLSIEPDRLIADPLVCICLEHFTESERCALERDLELAAQVQKGLLPHTVLERDGWHICYHYEPAGVVSGDYCDVVDAGDQGLYFMVGDVSGKGIAAAMLMAHLHAMFRTLVSVGLPLGRMLQHASRVFAQSTLPSQYATLVCGRAAKDGTVELSNAGHPAPLIVQACAVRELERNDLPIGLFATEEFSVSTLRLAPGDGLVIYSDGVAETNNMAGAEYTADRLRQVIERGGLCGQALLAACREDLAAFRGAAQKRDDVTLFVLSRQLTTH